jgi:Leucine-rich repeat (LRR) protein
VVRKIKKSQLPFLLGFYVFTVVYRIFTTYYCGLTKKKPLLKKLPNQNVMKLNKINSLLVLFFTFSISLSAQSYREFIALHELYQSTNGKEWNTTWDFDAPIETWEGVTVKNGHIVGLDLSNNNLNGEVPPTLVNLKHLIHLNLSGNELEGKLPNQLARMDSLAFFDVSNNEFTGGVPKSIGKMERLKSLQLAGNDFADYTGLEYINKNQLVAFDMKNEFKYLDLMDSKASGRYAETKFEDDNKK